MTGHTCTLKVNHSTQLLLNGLTMPANIVVTVTTVRYEHLKSTLQTSFVMNLVNKQGNSNLPLFNPRSAATFTCFTRV